jgi:hypothetical protein
VTVKKYPIRDVIEFGEQLIKTEDLDPVYNALVGAKLPDKQLKRLLLAYFCFYHLGAAAWLSEWEGEEFWGLMENAASNEIPPNMNGELPGERWPRGAERRHFRGDKCVAAVKKLREFSYGKNEEGVGDVPEYFIGMLAAMGGVVTLEGFMKTVRAFPLFGPWVAFKAADVLERVMGVPIEFPNELVFIYKEPRAALDLLPDPTEVTVLELLEHFKAFLAPPRYERQCNIQEVETILCKWKSSIGGHYWIGKDIYEVRKGLIGWGETADLLHAVMPRKVEKGLFK